MEKMSDRAELALDTVHQKPTHGIPTWLLNPMEWRMIDRLAGVPEATYQEEPVSTYRRMQIEIGCCMVDQWIPENPLSMGSAGYESDRPRTATTGAEQIVLDGIRIDSPEAVARHMEEVAFPALRDAIEHFDAQHHAAHILEKEQSIRQLLGPQILKAPYGYVRFPHFRYGQYGYVHYFMAYALYPELMERDFSLQADLAVLRNRAFVRACREAELPPLARLDHDMADSRGTLVDEKTLDRLWLPHFIRSIQPVRDAGIRMIWHCDGNLSAMLPRLLEAGLHGFQGFQYEDDMDYESICRMRTREGEPLIIIGGVSVTTTLPHGSPEDVRSELRHLVENGPPTGLFLGATSSITPGVPWENLRALVEGLNHYRTQGRGH
jgi:hypothetical protein